MVAFYLFFLDFVLEWKIGSRGAEATEGLLSWMLENRRGFQKSSYDSSSFSTHLALIFLTAISHCDLRNDFFFSDLIYFFLILFGFLLLLLFEHFSLFYLEFYFPYLFGFFSPFKYVSFYSIVVNLFGFLPIFFLLESNYLKSKCLFFQTSRN